MQPLLISDSAPDSQAIRGRLEFLDATRAFAAGSVMLEHGLERYVPSYLGWASHHFSFGACGVATFFLVSGFIIPVSLERHKTLNDFWVARAFRLYPLYWFSILVTLLFVWAGLFHLSPAFTAHPARTILANLAMVQLFVGSPDLIGLYWTLSMELVFYALCSVFYKMRMLHNSLIMVWGALLLNLLLTLSIGFILHRSFPAGRTALLVTAFFGGVLYRLFHGQLQRNRLYLLLPGLALSLTCGFWLRFHAYPRSFAEDWFTFPCVVASYVGAYAIFALLYLFRNRSFPFPLLWLGQISYSLYLLHGFALALVPPGRFPLVRLAVVFFLAIALASMTYRYIESPPLDLYKRMFRKRTRQRAHNDVAAASLVHPKLQSVGP